MKKTLLYIFAAALASMTLFSLQSCGLEEPYFGPQQDPSSGVVEFIARPVSYSNHDVTTKADGDPSTFEDDEIHNAFLLVFNEGGQRLLCEEINLTTEEGGLASKYGQLSVKIDRSLGSNVNACILANVPVNFARGITGTRNPNNNPNLIDGSANAYLNSAVLDFIYSTSTNVMATPTIDLDSNASTASVPCIPMFGPLTSINLANSPATVQIELKRLFAKVSVDLSLAVDLEDDGWNQVINGATYFDLNDFYLYNMPTKVRLMEDTSESAWIKTKSAFTSSIKGAKEKLQNDRVYNNNASSKIVFDFYVPEYYLNSKANPSTDEKLKPDNIQTGTYPIYLFLDATYSQYSLNSTDLQYKIYLGRNEHSDFSLARNVNYINYLKITGIDNHDGQGAVDIDHRVTTSVINNPVAKEGKSANCYIAARTGEYHFPAYKGAYNDLTLAVLCEGDENSEVVPLANDNPNGIELSKLEYDPDQNMIMFNINRIADGNVVIALKNGDGSIEWSWHLWCSTQSWWEGMLNTDWGELKPQTYPNGSMMADRNLGASSSLASGLYYTYGSKKPFITDKYYGGGTNGSETWNTKGKAVNDPCPPGYRIPDVGAWDPGVGAGLTSEYLYYYTEDIAYPYSGYLPEGSSSAVIQGRSPVEMSADDFTRSDSETENSSPVESSDKKRQTRTQTKTEYSYYDFEYEIPQNHTRGQFWCSNSEVFQYSYYSFSFEGLDYNSLTITKCKVRTRTVTTYQYRTRSLTFIPWNDATHWWQTERTEEGEWSSGSDVTDSNTLNQLGWKTALFLDQTFGGEMFFSSSDYAQIQEDNVGVQVRCIQED